MNRRVFAASAFVLLFQICVPSAHGSPPPARALAIRLDGELNDEAWRRAPSIDAFVQRDPHDGAAPTFRTEARVLYDDAVLYVAIRAFDAEPAKIVGILTRRDTQSPSDWVSVNIDSYHDRRTAYEFSVNAAGVKADKYRFADRSEDISWDAVWDVKVTKDAQGWKAEFRIPFSQLRFAPNDAGTFGFCVTRTVGRLNETSSWPHLPKSASGLVSSFGELTGLSLRQAGKRAEVVPYAVSQLRTASVEPGNPFARGADPGAAFGGDMKFALTPGLTVIGSINPDFGQVEADPAVVNLSAFETFFTERRPFFVEGSGIFRFDLDCNDGECRGLFYSRRIGRAPRGAPDVPENGFISSPAQTTILGASKLTGRAGSFSIGALNAVTSEETAHVTDRLRSWREAVEPLTSYSVGRATREFGNQSSLGFMMTATNRRLTSAVRFLPREAYTGGTDWDWRLGKGRYRIAGYWAGSAVRGDAEAIEQLQRSNVHSFQRPDAGHVEERPGATSLNGQAGQVSLGRIAGEHVRFSTYAAYKTPGFDANDLGFLARADEISSGLWVQWRHEKPSKYHRAVWLNVNQWNMWNFDRDRLARGGNVNGTVVLRANHRFSGGYTIEGAGFDDRATRGGPGARTNPARNFWHSFNSDDRRMLQLTYNLQYMKDGYGTHVFAFNPGVRVRPSGAISMTASIAYRRNVDDAQWIAQVTEPATHYVFGHLEQTTLGVTIRGNYTVTPTLSIQLYAQPFVSAGDYGRFKELIDGRAARYADRFVTFGYAGNPDFNYRAFRTTNVLRWEYRRGSTLFVVWQQGREDAIDRGDFRLGRDLRGSFGAPGYNVFLVKLAHWFNF